MLYSSKKLPSSSTCSLPQGTKWLTQRTVLPYITLLTLGCGITLHIHLYVYYTQVGYIQCFLTPGRQVRVSALPRGLPQATTNASNYRFWLAHLTVQSQMKSNLEQDFKKHIKLTLTKEK